ncbi:MAG TPA: translation initiation factor IF-3 [Candidatus Saccharimonadales bacterium]|nr:translation initiation factor IF-3 [Candidatus Saccharimonadales bacterium]
MSSSNRLNEFIRAPKLRIIDESGKQIGILSRAEALDLAKEQGLDLVEISPDANPPVAKIIDWGKYSYQRTKQSQKNRRRSLEIKQMRIGLKIGEHDLKVKLDKVNNFLEAGHKVKLTVFFRGREMAHKELGFKMADRVIEKLGDKVVVEQAPNLAGNQLHFVVRSSSHAKA